MPANKDRLYVALYARGGAPKMPGLEDTYHWALIVGPKVESADSLGRRYHARERMVIDPIPRSAWQYEDLEVSLAQTSMLLVRVVVAKVKSRSRIQSIFEGTPLRPEVDGWNCVEWVKEALEAALKDGAALGTSANGWKSVRDKAMWYIEKKKAAHRFDGEVQSGPAKPPPTWDMLEGKELIA